MIKIIAAILIIVPTLEIWGLTAAGKTFGWFPTLLLVILTGVVGAWLAKKEGLRVWRSAQIQLQQGQLPGEAILDGLSIFAGGLLLLTPGFFTDTIGFLLVFSIYKEDCENFH